MTVIDAHQHFWSLARGDYRFPRADDPTLYRDFLPEDLAPMLKSAGIDQTILVQATDTIAETRYLLEIASRHPFIGGVVGWWDPRRPEGSADIGRWSEDGALVGVRPMLQGLDDISFLIAPDALAQVEIIAAKGLVFDALIDPSQLGIVAELCRRVPTLQVVIDHMAKPWHLPARHEHWVAGMHELAQFRNCAVKVSGYPFGSAVVGDGAVEALVGLLRATFGSERLLWGSDWPVAEREGGYSMVLERMQALFGVSEREAVFGDNAARIYGLPRQRTSHTR